MNDEEIRIGLAQVFGFRRMIHEAQYYFQAPEETRWRTYGELPDWLHDPARAHDLDKLLSPPGAGRLADKSPREKAEIVLRLRGLWNAPPIV